MTTQANTVELGMYMIKSLPKGEFIKLKPDSNKVYQRGDYDRATGKYELIDCDDVNHVVYRKGNAMVQAGFTY